MKNLFLFFFFLPFTIHASERRQSEFCWFDGEQYISYSLSKNVSPVVITAMEMFSEDMLDVTGVPLKNEGVKAKVRIVQLDKDRSANRFLRVAGVDVASLSKRKDAFCIKVSGNQLLVVGSNARGTAYGILELSRMAGVSPWKWWADEQPERRNRLSLPQDFITIQSPSVEYRGIFLNDEDWSLLPWSWRTFSPAQQGLLTAKTYKQVFKLLMRLRANTIWPAMHESTTPFFFVPGAKEVADSCGIVIGTSHCEPMMRNNVGEWHVWAKRGQKHSLDPIISSRSQRCIDSNAKESGEYNYITNKEGVQNYWIERLKEVGRYENIYTIGMRGIHDGAMEGAGKNLNNQTAALQQVINDQRALLGKYVSKCVEHIPQQFVPYKEVLQVMENGLSVPEDVMLTWCDDNYGYMTRLSDSIQQKRKGGAGVYYHLSYWGRPHDYLWLSTTQPGLIYNEMREAYDHNARRLWIANVHDLKTAAYDLELFLDMAWNINSVQPNTIFDHQLQWLCREFGKKAGERLLPVMKEYYRLTAIRKPEFMGWTQVELDKKKYRWGWSDVTDTEFSLTAFGGELDRYLSDWQRITNSLKEIEKECIPKNRHATFFSHVKYPVLSAAAMSRKMLEAQRARAIAKAGNALGMREKDDALLTACAKSQDAYQEIRSLTAYYNNQLADGKWRHLISCNPRGLYVFYAPKLPLLLTNEEVEEYKNRTDNTVGEIVDDGTFIARNACQWNNADTGTLCVQSLGHSMNAVRLPKGKTVSYTFQSLKEGNAILRIALIPTQPNDKGDLRFSVSIDGDEPQTFSLKEPFRSEGWKQNVLRQQALRQLPISLTKGSHTLSITALDNHIILDQWMLDFKTDRKAYMFPILPMLPESMN